MIQSETKWRHREGIKRNRRDMPEVSYEELEDDLDELDKPKRCLITNPAAKLGERELMETENQQDVLKRQAPVMQSETKWRHREGIKRNWRDRPDVSYEELENDLDELDKPKRCLITNPAAKLEERELMRTENQPDVLKRQAPVMQSETKWRHREGIKRNRRDMPEVSYEELEDDLDELDEPKRCRQSINCISKPCSCTAGTQPIEKQQKLNLQPNGTVHPAEHRRGAVKDAARMGSLLQKKKLIVENSYS